MASASNTLITPTTGAQFDPPITSVSDARVVLLNGPPGSGKDTAGLAITRTFNSSIMKFAGPIKRAVHADFNLPPDTPDDIFENCKDDPNPALFGHIPRKEYIHKSEQDMKPRFGPDFYGLLALRTLWRDYERGTRLFVVTDSGFASEAEPIVNFVGRLNCLLIRIYAELRGKTFQGDSRSYITIPGVLTLEISNDEADPIRFQAEVVNIVRHWMH
jgi:hypothetical protein